jgi:ClpA/ClpB-like protein
MEAARRKFSPEFMNRIDKVIVFRALMRPHLEEILDIELGRGQERVMAATGGSQFVFRCTPAARNFLLREGTDAKFGARHLKRAIERRLVFPLRPFARRFGWPSLLYGRGAAGEGVLPSRPPRLTKCYAYVRALIRRSGTPLLEDMFFSLPRGR